MAAQETWLDWQGGALPPRETLLTREQVVNHLADIGMPTNEGKVRFWEYHGVLPRGVRLWDHEAKARRAYYPDWYVEAVALLANKDRSQGVTHCPCCGQRTKKGSTLTELAAIVRGRYQHHSESLE